METRPTECETLIHPQTLKVGGAAESRKAEKQGEGTSASGGMHFLTSTAHVSNEEGGLNWEYILSLECIQHISY